MEHQQQQLPNATLILVFGILSIVTCCCYGIIGLVLGIVTVVLANKATKLYMENPDFYTGYQNVKTGKILGIIGIVLGVLALAYFAWVISVIGWEALQDPELLREKMEELQGV